MRNSRPGPEDWRGLLRTALAVLDDAAARGPGRPPHWTMGGGTVLMLRFGHRVSRDIDLFLDPQWLGILSPRLNDYTAGLAEAYEETGSALKLVLARGDIDFVAVAPAIPGAPPERTTFEGQDVLLDPSEEILARKLLYRPASLRARDVFDLAACAALDPPAATAAMQAAWSRREVLLRRLDELAQAFDRRLESEVDPLPAGRPLLVGCLERVRDLVGGAKPPAGVVPV